MTITPEMTYGIFRHFTVQKVNRVEVGKSEVEEGTEPCFGGVVQQHIQSSLQDVEEHQGGSDVHDVRVRFPNEIRFNLPEVATPVEEALNENIHDIIPDDEDEVSESEEDD